MEFNEEIVFAGGINTDDDVRNVPKGDYRDFAYCRIGNVSGAAFSVVTSWGTVEITSVGIQAYDKVLGATFWEKQNAIVYFVFKANGQHQIWVYYITGGGQALVLQSDVLNFSREWPIYHANVVDDICKWTDGRWDEQMYEADGTRLFNPPYQINLQKALDEYYPTVDLRTIDAIKWPMDPPRVSYFTDTTRQDNKLRNKLFKFIIQPIYENGEVGVWSMYSNLDLPERSELVTGTNWVYLNNSNGINIQFFTGPKIIRKFNIAVQQFDKNDFGTEPPFGVFLQLDKTQDNIADNIYHTIDFYGGVATAPAIDVLKNYDRLPVIADCQEYLPTSQLTYVNFREGYNKPTQEYEILDVQVDYELNEINVIPKSYSNSFTAEIYLGFVPIFRITNNFFLAYYFDPTVVFPYQVGNVFSFTNWSNSELIFYTISFSDIQNALLEPSVGDQNIYILQKIGDSFTDQIGIPNGTASIVASILIYEADYAGATLELPKPIQILRQTDATPSLKSGATHEFGIVYGDRAYRDNTVYTVDSMNLFVPWFYDINRSGLSNEDNPFTINPRFTINHIPPIWADRYWIVSKPATEVASFGQYTTNANDPLLPPGSGYVSSISLDLATNNRYVIQIDQFYETQNIGAKIRHQIKIGDKIRFIRRRADNPGFLQSNASKYAYLPYLELDVIDYDSSGGEDGRQRVYTNIFNTGLIENGLSLTENQIFGQLIEIYTPRTATDDTGNIFVSTWKDISTSLPIIDPHTEDRAHGASPLYYLSVSRGALAYIIALEGDYSFLEGTTQNYTIHYKDGTSASGITDVTQANYSQSSNRTIFGLFGITPGATFAYITFDGKPQEVNNLSSFRPATFPLSYGDVYVRQRNYQTGFNADFPTAFYYIEDPNYSDYWSSDVHSTGRFRIEDQNAKMSHRKAVAIHSDSYIVGTQINGLSSFSLDNNNIEEMNSLYGGVVRAYMSGREGKTLKCLQPKKENSIYIQFYPNEVGSDSTVRVSNRTFASWFDYRSLYGCTDAGATAQLPDGSTMYFDNNSGVFILSQSNGQSVVSEIDPDSGKDFKFRTKTKQLAKTYNADPLAVVRTYVNETMGEVGFAFRFGGLEGAGFTAFAIRDPLEARVWKIDGDYSATLINTNIVINQENGVGVYGQVTYAVYDSILEVTYIQVDGNGPLTTDIAMKWYSDYKVQYDHVVFDYINMRWRSTYDYSFSQFAHFGQALVGWNETNEFYLHNQESSVTFHGEPFIQKISFVSNENPMYLKRYQDFTQRANKTFSVTASSTPNQSYPKGMYTQVPSTVVNVYEGYSRGAYKKNLYDPRFYSTGGDTTSIYEPTNDLDGWVIAGDQTGILGINIIIVQGSKNYIGGVVMVDYNPLLLSTKIKLSTGGSGVDGVTGFWYKSEIAMLNGEDIRAYALTHDLTYDPSVDGQGSVLSTVGITGVLS